MRDLIAEFPVTVDIPVAWGEMDAYQHVNNTVYFRYFETARIAYFQQVGLVPGGYEGVGPILASTQCRYRVPLTYPDTVTVASRVSQVDRDRFTMQYRVVSHHLGRVAAEGEGVIVTYRYAEARKADMPAELRARIEALEAGVRRSAALPSGAWSSSDTSS